MTLSRSFALLAVFGAFVAGAVGSAPTLAAAQDLPDLVVRSTTGQYMMAGHQHYIRLKIENLPGTRKVFDPVLKKWVPEPYYVDATNVGLRAQIPTIFTIDALYAPAGFACSASGGVISCSGGSVAGGSEAVIVVLVTAPLQEGTFQHSATVDPNNQVAERNEANNSGVFSVQVGWIG